MRRVACLAFSTLLIACSGCTSLKTWHSNGFKVGPEYCKPVAPVADDWIDSYDERISTDLPNDQSWWYTFGDPVLPDLVQAAYEQNLTLRSAGMQVVQARAIRAITAGEFFPQQQEAFGSYSRNQVSRNTFPGVLPGIPRSSDFWATGFDAFWEVDVWGKFRRNIESADASLDAAVESYDDILVILVADVASTYVEYRTLQQQLAYTRSNIELQKKSLSIAAAQNKGGEVTELDPLQAQADLQNTEQTLPALEAQLRNANLALCTLLGIPPRDLAPELGDAEIPTAPPAVAVGIPADLLRRRPDVRQAERQVAAQAAQIGVAEADLYPHFSISGSISLQAGELRDLFETASTTGTVGPGFNWDILNYGRLKNNVRLQDAAFQQLAVDYQQTVLEANQEIETALNNYLKSQERLQDFEELVETVTKAVEIGLAQYRVGSTDFNRVSSLQLALVDAQDGLAAAQGEVAQSLIAVYKAIGGGWQIRLGGPPQVSLNAFPDGAVLEDLSAPISQDPVVGREPTGQSATNSGSNTESGLVEAPVEDATTKPDPQPPVTDPHALPKPPADPVRPAPKPVQPAPVPVKQNPKPVQPAPEPIKPVPKPVKPAPEPVKPTPEDAAAKAAADAAAKAAQDAAEAAAEAAIKAAEAAADAAKEGSGT